MTTEKVRAANRSRYHRDLEKSRARTSACGRKARTGWTQNDFDLAWLNQQGQCFICGLALTKKSFGPDRPCCDHNHSTGQKRRLLCARCNLMIGHARESAELLRAGAEYLDALTVA